LIDRLLLRNNLGAVGADPEVQVVCEFFAVRIRLVRLTAARSSVTHRNIQM